MVEWGYDETDVSDLKVVCFDYIRARYEGKEFRDIAKPSKKESIFCKETIWKDFLAEHKKTIDNAEEKSIDELRGDNPDCDLSKMLQARDNDWSDKVHDLFQGNLRKSFGRVEDLNEANMPLELIEKALSSLEAINTSAEIFYDAEVGELLKKINSLTYEMMKMNSKGRKNAAN